MDLLFWAYEKITGEFGLGLVLGMVIMAFWDEAIISFLFPDLLHNKKKALGAP